MLKKTMIASLFLSTILFANESEIKKPNLAKKVIENQSKTIEKQDINKLELASINSNLMGQIVVNGETITIQDKETRDKLIEVINKDFLVKHPKVKMEIELPKEVVIEEIDVESCKSCHGYSFDKAALGSSKVLSKMSKEELLEALNGYKDGTYGSSMKSMMRTQVLKYTDEEIKAIVDYIVKNKENLNK